MTERVGVIARIRALAVGVAKAYVDQQKAAETPPADGQAGVREAHKTRSATGAEEASVAVGT